jgi:hypothetical protein
VIFLSLKLKRKLNPSLPTCVGLRILAFQRSIRDFFELQEHAGAKSGVGDVLFFGITLACGSRAKL